MSGQRISGRAFVLLVGSPPFGAAEGTDYGDDDFQVYRCFPSDAAGAATRITNFSDSSATVRGVWDPVLSPDGSKILFAADETATGRFGIWVCNANGSGSPTQLLTDPDDFYLTPAWHPDSDQFVCIHGFDGFDGAVVKSAVSTPGVESTALKTTDGTNSPYRPQFNYDGSRIAYFWDKISGTGCDLRVMDDDGSNDSSLDNTLTAYQFGGAQSSWANDQDSIVYHDGAVPSKVYVINGDGTGKTQLNANGDAAGINSRVSHLAWPDDDSYVVISINQSNVWVPTRCELDGSDSAILNSSHGGSNSSRNQQCLVFNNRIWFVERTAASGGSGWLMSSCALDGTDYRVDLDASLGTAMDTTLIGGFYGDAG